MLSGDQLVIRGAKKADVSLPEVGLKEVVPNGSWLELKQVQNALEARKHLIEVERIEKCGSISHAEWRDDLKLAEVIKHCGSHWQFLGHNIGKCLYIYPEEALLLMESNCLLLRYNEVIVSIQQAYALLLGDQLSLVQYKVYSSLSRLGYRVLRHDNSGSNNTRNTETKNTVEAPTSLEECQDQASEVINIPKDVDIDLDTAISENTNKSVEDAESDKQGKIEETENDKSNENEEYAMEIQNEIESTNEIAEVSSTMNIPDISNIPEVEKRNENNVIGSEKLCNNKTSTAFIHHKLEVLSSRELRPCNADVVNHSFDENLPDLSQKHIVTIKAPEEQLIPRNVFLNNTAYVLNLENLRLKNVTPAPSSSTQTYNNTDDVNEQHVRRIRSSLSNESVQNNWNPQFFPNMRFPQQTNHFRHFNYWNQYNFNLAFQRPFFQNIPLRFQFFPRMQQMFRCFPPAPGFPHNVQNSDMGRTRKRKRHNPKKYHLESIKKLAAKLKNLVDSGNRQEENIQALQRLIHTYNLRYKSRLELTQQLEVVEDEIILETIELEDDEQSSPKKQRKSDDKHKDAFEENFNAIKKFASMLKELEDKEQSSPRHRRAFSNAIKTFNKSYDAEIYVDPDYNVKDKRQIVITSSDSECAVESTPKPKKCKKLKNPFYILKQLSEKNAAKSQTEPERASVLDSSSVHDKDYKYSEVLTKTFSRDWLPNENDFGRAEVICRRQMESRFMEHSIEFLFEFMKGQQYNNWLDAKLAYWQSCKKSAEEFDANPQPKSDISINSLINPEDCTDMESVLKKLSIIKTNKDVKEECPFKIDYDVYNRDVPNFKKTNKPRPHFRVICIEETSDFPDGIDFATHNATYVDDITVVFAIVGISSISYIQINSTDLPVYLPNSSLP